MCEETKVLKAKLDDQDRPRLPSSHSSDSKVLRLHCPLQAIVYMMRHQVRRLIVGLEMP